MDQPFWQNGLGSSRAWGMPWFFIKSKGNPEGETGKDEKKPWAVRLLYSCNIVYFVYSGEYEESRNPVFRQYSCDWLRWSQDTRIVIAN